jgi:DNA mismatch repair protein MutL
MAIRVLPPEIASRIAAGEVVERPASIVKELVENALDAGASRISVEIGGGGLNLIRVVDNGSGIEPEELALAFARHATSKLRDDAHLEAITTLGFRGEALPSIAAVAEVEAVSRPAENGTGARVRFHFGRFVDQTAAGAPAGTSISVRRLFQEQPARRKFLRSAGAETSQIASVVSHYALAYPEVAFSLRVDGRESFVTSGSGSRREAAGGVYGGSVAAALIEVSEADEGSAIEALVAPPSLSRASRNYVTLFINRRWVRSRSLSYAVEEAYSGLLQTGRYPLAIIDIRLPAEEVDVNVHPAKAEVRLCNERQVFALVQRPIRRALSGLSPVGSESATGWPRAFEPAAPSILNLRPQPYRAPFSFGAQREAVVGAALDAAPAIPERQEPLPARVPILRPLGQAGTTYIIAEGPSGLYLIDQHAAHERVLFERFLAAESRAAEVSQPLLQPVALELTPVQQSLLTLYAPAMRERGFEVEPFGPGGYLLRTAPSSLRHDPSSGSGRGDPARAFVELLDLLTRDDAPAEPRLRVAASLACHAAVRAGQSLAFDEMRDLLQQLEACETPQTCPHGRPTMVHLSADELAKRFSRK